MPTSSVSGPNMAPVVRQLLKQVAQTALHVLGSLVLLCLLAGAGYWVGDYFDQQQGEEFYRWIGAALGSGLWLIVRPRHRKKRPRRGSSSSSGQPIAYHDETHIDDGSWFASADDDGDGGSSDD